MKRSLPWTPENSMKLEIQAKSGDETMQCTDQSMEIGPSFATTYPNTTSLGGTQPKENKNLQKGKEGKSFLSPRYFSYRAVPQAERNKDDEMEHCSFNEEPMEWEASREWAISGDEEMERDALFDEAMQCTDPNMEIGPSLAASYPNTISRGGTQPEGCENLDTSNQQNVLIVNVKDATSQKSIEVKLPKRADAINISIVNQSN